MNTETTKVALAGFGAWGRMHARAIARIDGAEVTAVLCRRDDAADVLAAFCPKATIFRSYEDMLAHAEYSVVNVAVPNQLHAEFAIKAMEAGANVFLEKPIGLSLAECDAVTSAARQTNRLVSVNHELRVSRQWGRLRTLIEEGTLGAVRYQNFSLFRRPFRIGSSGWRFDQAAVGSWLLEELIHFVDLILWYGRENGDPISVLAEGNGVNADLPDNVSIMIRWGNGAFATLNQCLSGFEHHSLLEVSGDAGAVRTWWSGLEDRTETPEFSLRIRDPEGCIRDETVAESGEAFELTESLRLAYDRFREGRSLLSPEEAAKAVAVCLACEQSLKSGLEVRLDDLEQEIAR